jgi:hypothetical protein
MVQMVFIPYLLVLKGRVWVLLLGLSFINQLVNSGDLAYSFILHQLLLVYQDLVLTIIELLQDFSS